MINFLTSSCLNSVMNAFIYLPWMMTFSFSQLQVTGFSAGEEKCTWQRVEWNMECGSQGVLAEKGWRTTFQLCRFTHRPNKNCKDIRAKKRVFNPVASWVWKSGRRLCPKLSSLRVHSNFAQSYGLIIISEKKRKKERKEKIRRVKLVSQGFWEFIQA